MPAFDTLYAMSYLLLALDMDDTLLNSRREIHPENLRILRELKDRGIYVVLCSGRPTASLIRHSRILHGDMGGQYQISFNGAKVTETASGREIFSRSLDPEAGRSILEAARRHGILLQAYGDRSFFVESDDPRAQAYEKSISLPCERISDLDSIIAQGTPKLLMNATREKLAAVREDLEHLHGQGNFSMVYSKPEYLEFMDPKVNKGSGLLRLCDYLGIPVEHSIGVGDSENDLELLRSAGLGLAVANAREAVKAAADRVLMGTNNDSFMEEIERLYFRAAGRV